MSNKKKYKNQRWVIVAIWLIIGTLLLLSVNAVNNHPEWKETVNRLVIIYVCAFPVIAGIVFNLKRKENRSIE